jgi:D-glucosaminate-6-phosphate ammonia-lyase
MREIAGTLEGDQVKLSSMDKHIADNIPFIFWGTVSGDKMNGQIYLGEYLTARFSAVRHFLKGTRRPIKIPKGQPLAT